MTACPDGHECTIIEVSGANPSAKQKVMDWHYATPGRPCGWSMRPMPPPGAKR